MALAAVGVKTQIWNNQLKSALLLLGFPVLLLLMLWGFFYLGVLFDPQDPLVASQGNSYALMASLQALKQYWYIAIIAALGWYAIAALSCRSIINAATHAKSLARSDAPDLYNMLENLCISRGLSMPRLCIIETNALNAFASGISKESYTVTVTRGLINTLNPQEMETVLAHELTHIINEDVYLMMIGIVFTGILALACNLLYDVFRYRIYWRTGRDKRFGAFLLAAFIVFFIGRLFAIALKLALSRKREYLADAGAVELTKNPDALISALRKISQNPKIEHINGDIAEMCVIDFVEDIGELFSIHPSLESRIEALVMMGGVDQPSSYEAAKGPWA